MGHLLDVLVERLRGLEEGLEVGTLSEALQMSLGGVPLDADDLLIRLVDAASGLPALAVRRGIEQRTGMSVGLYELIGAARFVRPVTGKNASR
jgi:hypothetical protein